MRPKALLLSVALLIVLMTMALMMALGMTLAMIVMVSSIRETVRVWVETTLRSDLWIKAAAGKSSGIVGDLPAAGLEQVLELREQTEKQAAAKLAKAENVADEARLAKQVLETIQHDDVAAHFGAGGIEQRGDLESGIQEMLDYTRKVMRDADLDGDGVTTRAEFAAAAKRQK